MPWTPSSVVILRVTKLRPGQQTMTLAAVIFIGFSGEGEAGDRGAGQRGRGRRGGLVGDVGADDGAEVRVGLHTQRAAVLGGERRPARSRRSGRSWGRSCQRTRSATGSPATSRSAATMSPTATEMPGTLTDRLAANAVAGASCPTTRLAITARGDCTHIRVRRRHRADRLDAGQRLADDAARERRGRLVRLAGTHGHRRQAQAAAVDRAPARGRATSSSPITFCVPYDDCGRERRVVGDGIGQPAAEDGDRAREHELRRSGAAPGSDRGAAGSRRG